MFRALVPKSMWARMVHSVPPLLDSFYQDHSSWGRALIVNVATLLWVKWEDETPTPKVGDLESSGTPKCLEFDSRGQSTSH
jgi:hypothetical protein